MTNKHTVLIAVDGSENSESALEYYCKKLHRPENNVVILHAAEEPSVQGYNYHWAPPSVTPASYQKLLDTQQQNTENMKTKFSDKCQMYKIPASFQSIHCPRAAEGIVDYSKKNNVDTVVLGSRGLGTLRRTFLGSVSDYVLHHCDKPVTVIPHKD